MPETVKSEKCRKGRAPSLVMRSIRDARRISPHIFTFMTIHAITSSVSPFVNVYFTAAIIDVLANGGGAAQTAPLVIAALLLNCLLYFVRNAVGYQYQIRRYTLSRGEMARINEKVFTMNYALLESPEIYAKIRR